MTKHTHEENQIHEHTNCIRIVPIFNHLDDDTMDKIGEKVITRTYSKGELIYQAGDIDQTLYIVNKGQIRIYRLSESGKEQIIRVLNPGYFTGERALFEEASEREEYAEAMRDTVVCTISKKDFQEIIQNYPAISVELLNEMSKRLAQSEKQTASVAVESVTNRIILYLEENLDPEAGNSPTVELPMQRKDIASYLGTTPETLSRKFLELEEAGLIQQLAKNRIKINDLDELLFYEG